MPLPWYYWAVVGTFFLVGCISAVVAITTTDEKEDRTTIAVCSVAFFCISGGFTLYPILRRREPQGIRTERIRIRGAQHDAMLFPASRITQSAALFGSFLAALFLTALVVRGGENYHIGKAVIGAVAFWGIFLAALWSTLKGRPGIALIPEGIVWCPFLGQNSFLPWPDIAQCNLFMKPGKYNSKGNLAIGVNLVDSLSFQPDLLFRNRIKSNQLTNGWHFTYSAETMAAPLFWVSAVINYYLQHPEDRREISTAAGLARAEGVEVQTALIPPPAAM